MHACGACVLLALRAVRNRPDRSQRLGKIDAHQDGRPAATICARCDTLRREAAGRLALTSCARRMTFLTLPGTSGATRSRISRMLIAFPSETMSRDAIFDSCRRFLTALLCASGHVLRPALGQHACFLVGVLIEQARIDVQPPCCFQHADDPRKMAHRRQSRANLLPVVHPR